MVGNGTDEDCDNFDALYRRLTERQFPSANWNWSGTVSDNGCAFGPDSCTVSVGGDIVNSSIRRTYSLAIPRGKVHAVLALEQNTVVGLSTCALRIKTESAIYPPNPTWAEFDLAGAGTGTVTTGALGVTAAPRVLKEIEVVCDPFASVTLDWLMLQNTDDVVPPPTEASISWSDVGMPGGGLTSSIIRAGDSGGPFEGYLFGTSDVGGVAMKDVILGTGWEPIVGEHGWSLTTQPDLGTWDVLPSSWGELFLLSGRLSNAGVVGGFHSYDLAADRWTTLIDSQPNPDNNDANEVTIAGYSRYGACGGYKEYGGGRQLVEEPDLPGVYIANHDVEDMGLVFWDDDDDEACMLASADLPLEPIGAIARVETSVGRYPALLVGVRSLTPGDPTLYVCDLPYTVPGLLPMVSLDCSTNAVDVTCEPVAWSGGVDVRDIEVDPLDSSVAYVASGGNDPALNTDEDELTFCEDGIGGVFEVFIDQLAGEPDVGAPIDISSGLTELSSAVEVTGVSMDPDGDFLFAFLPVSPGSNFTRDRIYRIATEDIGTAAWVAINQDAGDESSREANMDLSGAWLESSTTAKPRPYPARYGPGHGIDAVWYIDDSAPWDICQGDRYFAAIPTTYNAWGVSGLDYVPFCPSGGPWDPAADTEWSFWPEVDSELAWQTTAVLDVAVDDAGNIWSAAPDMALSQSIHHFDGYVAEVDCLWNGMPAGANNVVAVEGAVWATLYQQGLEDGDIPQILAVVRTVDNAVVDYGDVWSYEGAANLYYGEFEADLGGNEDLLACVDHDVLHTAAPFFAGEAPGDNDGHAFSNDDANPLETEPSWGNPSALDALSVDSAIVSFEGYTYSAGYHVGRIGYTVDSGEHWNSVPFDGDYTDDLGSGETCETAGGCACDEAAFMDRVGGLSLLRQPDRSYITSATDWRLEFFAVSGKPGGEPTVEENHCSLARIVLDPTGADWTWYGLDNGVAFPGCAMTAANLSGISTSLWGDEAYLWGTYSHYSNGTHRGGVCTVDFDDPLAARTQIVSPATWQFGIGAVAPHPYVVGLLAVGPVQTAPTYQECMEDGAGECPDQPRLLMADKLGTGWQVSQLHNPSPNPNTSGLEWMPLADLGVVQGSGGSGTWLGEISWE